MAFNLKSFVGGATFVGGALLGIATLDYYVFRPSTPPEEPSVKKGAASDELVAAVKTVIDDHNASIPAAAEEALAEFKKSSPDGEGRIVKSGDIFKIYQDPAIGGEYGDYFCVPDCIRFDDIQKGRVPEIVASALDKDETALNYTSEEFENSVLDTAFKMGGITYASAGNKSHILATYDPSSDRVCQERQKVENGKVSDETFQDCFFAAALPQSVPLAADIAAIKAFAQTVSASPVPAP